MANNGMTIDDLNTVAAMTAQDEVPVWDNEASGEPTKKVTGQNLANSVKSLANLPNTTEMNTALSGKQDMLTFDTTPIMGSNNPVTSGGVYTAIQQSTAIFNAVRLNSASNKTSHTINIPTDSAHFLIICSTSYGLNAYGIVATTSGGLVNENNLAVEGITLSVGTGTLIVNVGSTARPLVVIDICIRGEGHCTLS